MPSNEFSTICKDFVGDDGTVKRKGCGLTIVMKKDLTEGKWRPYNTDGSPHKHQELPRETKKVVQLPITPSEEWINSLIDKRLKEHGFVW